MAPGSGFGIPGWFVAFSVVLVVLGVGTMILRISTVRRIARNAGLDPNTATAVSLLSNDGVGAAYVASTLASRSAQQSVQRVEQVTAEHRLRELQALKDQGLVSDEEYSAQRGRILGSI